MNTIYKLSWQRKLILSYSSLPSLPPNIMTLYLAGGRDMDGLVALYGFIADYMFQDLD